MNELLQERNQAIADRAQPLPGSVAHDNIRPINVPGRFEGWTLYEVMCASHPHIERDEWTREFELGRILKDDIAVGKETVVRGGQQFSHLFPNTIEPDVNANIRVIYEDDAIVVVNKPAPLPLHPSGRFNHNTLVSLLNTVYSPTRLRVVHRLDANTSGVVLFGKDAKTATHLRLQFDNGQVAKQYVVRCMGHPSVDSFDCDQPIGKQRGKAGLRTIDSSGKPSLTQFTLVKKLSDATSIMIARPITGRTNQIRIHLWHEGIPVLGDPLYFPNHQLGRTQTLPVDAPPMCLHASRMSLIHPHTEREVTFKVENPDWIPDSVECA